ncbi:MAG: hypothetical protein GY774_24720 [Planctomycetes bacterium]|nr:hypothetical protein [Planctomycetota bacterium]
MKYAIINNQRAEPSKGAKGACPACGAEMIAKCGEIKINHWAHKSNEICDPWWENETAWHREWKNCFNVEWQEFVHKDMNTGEIHIADVTTPYGWTIEIQHSPMSDEERKARNSFYKKIVWIVDGTRRKRDVDQLNHLLDCSVPLNTKTPTYAINPDSKNRLLDEWYNNDSLVFLDFKQAIINDQKSIWFVLPWVTKDFFIKAIPTSLFVNMHINGEFDQFITHKIRELSLDYSKQLNRAVRSASALGCTVGKFSWLRI